MDYVFYRGFFTIVDRGMQQEFNREGKTINVQKINQEIINANGVEDLMNCRELDNDNSLSILKSFLNRFVSHELSEFDQLIMNSIDQIKPKPQKAGNCAWAAMKASLRVALAFLLIQPGMDANTVKAKMDEAKAISKVISTAMRLCLHMEYLKAHPNGEKDPLYDKYLVDISRLKVETHLRSIPKEKADRLRELFRFELPSGSSAAQAASSASSSQK